MAKADKIETNRKWFCLTRVDDSQKKSGDAIETKTLRVGAERRVRKHGQEEVSVLG